MCVRFCVNSPFGLTSTDSVFFSSGTSKLAQNYRMLILRIDNSPEGPTARVKTNCLRVSASHKCNLDRPLARNCGRTDFPDVTLVIYHISALRAVTIDSRPVFVVTTIIISQDCSSYSARGHSLCHDYSRAATEGAFQRN